MLRFSAIPSSLSPLSPHFAAEIEGNLGKLREDYKYEISNNINVFFGSLGCFGKDWEGHSVGT
jgi:hypothetical protein